MATRKKKVHKGRQSSDLLSTFVLDLEDEFLSNERPTFIEWVNNVVLEGKPFSFKNHEYLMKPYEDEHVYQVYIKACQLGLTTLAMMRVFYEAIHGSVKGILYLFPSKSDVSDFSRGRINTFMDENPDTIGNFIKNTDSINIKQIGNAFLYLRGMKSRVGLKSIPVDHLYADESDEGDQLAFDMSRERMSHSEQRRELYFSNPTLSDYGISELFEQTDQRFWLLKCPKCNEYTDLVNTFPDSLHTVKGKVIRACMKCGAELDISKGEWVAKHPDVLDKRGYQFSQLYSYYIKPEDLLHQFKTTTNLQDFWNLKIGLGYIEAENRLEMGQILGLCGDEGIYSNCKESCFMGVDVGKLLHVTIAKKHSTRFGQTIHIGEYKDFSDLDQLMKRFNVSCCVIDSQPEQRAARAFAERFPSRVFMCYYNRHQKGSYKWNDRELTITVNRTESLDTLFHTVINENLVLPRQTPIVSLFAKHINSIAKKLEEDDTGNKIYHYIKLKGQDHFAHSLNYCLMAIGSKRQFLYDYFAKGEI